MDPEIQSLLDEMGPWGRRGVRQQTEPDVILESSSHVILIECKLGVPGKRSAAWQRSSKGMPRSYLGFVDSLGWRLFNESFDYGRDGHRFYQLFRNYVLGAGLASRWEKEFSLLAVVNGLNTNLRGRSHAEEFESFRAILEDSSNAYLLTWQRVQEAVRCMSQLGEYLSNHRCLD